MRTTLTIFLFLSISFSFSSYAQPDEPIAQRKTGCSDPRFVEAELKAYQELLRARTEIEQWRTDTITRLERRKDAKLSFSSKTYNNNLNSCAGDADCNAGAKNTYDKETKEALYNRDEGLKIVREIAAIKYKEVQDAYDKAVEEAIKLYCHGFNATGQTADVVYSGAVCDLNKPFTILGTIASAGIIYPFKFVPSAKNDHTGTFSFYTTWKIAVLQGTGTYSIEGAGTGHHKILMKASSSGTIPTGTVYGNGNVTIDLVPLEGKECKTP